MKLENNKTISNKMENRDPRWREYWDLLIKVEKDEDRLEEYNKVSKHSNHDSLK